MMSRYIRYQLSSKRQPEARAQNHQKKAGPCISHTGLCSKPLGGCVPILLIKTAKAENPSLPQHPWSPPLDPTTATMEAWPAGNFWRRHSGTTIRSRFRLSYCGLALAIIGPFPPQPPSRNTGSPTSHIHTVSIELIQLTLIHPAHSPPLR